VAGVAYEIIKLLAKHYETSRLARLIIAPGLAVQRLTTREPSPEMLEVSICALKQVLNAEGLLKASADEDTGLIEDPATLADANPSSET
jgi:uncharacterized protein YqhQ